MSSNSDAEVTPSTDAIATLRSRVSELEGDLRMMLAVLDTLPQGLFWKDANLVIRGCNRIGRQTIGVGADDAKFIGFTDHDFPWNREQADAFVAEDRAVMASRTAQTPTVSAARDANGETHWIEGSKAPIFDPSGEVIGVLGIFTDVTRQKLAEQAMAAEQRAAILRISTPLLPVADGVIVLPLIGSLAPERAEEVMQALLAGVVEHRATTAILDITGLQTVDTSAAEALVRAARAIRLLGAEAVVTGVRPAVAQTLVALGTELGDLVVLGDLKAGVRHALARRTARA